MRVPGTRDQRPWPLFEIFYGAHDDDDGEVKSVALAGINITQKDGIEMLFNRARQKIGQWKEEESESTHDEKGPGGRSHPQCSMPLKQ